MQFPVLQRPVQGKTLVYLDSACTALKSRPVIKAMNDFYLHRGVCGGKRSTHLLAQKVEEDLAQARAQTARFIGAASANEIVFTSGTTEAFNLLARAFPFGENKNEVILTDLEHNAVLLPFLELAKSKKIRLKILPTQEGTLDVNRLESLLTGRTALLVMTRSSNVYGGRLPLADAVRLAHQKGALVATDAAQSVSNHEENVQETDVDFFAFSAHKLGGPFGCGVLYGKEHLLNRLENFKVGGGTIRSLQKDPSGGWSARYLDAPLRFEAGVGNYAGIEGLGAAIGLLHSAGYPVLRRHVGQLVEHAHDALLQIPRIEILGKRESLVKGSLISFVFKDTGIAAADFNLYLNHELTHHAVAIRTGEHCAHLLHTSRGLKETVRVSFFGYNSKKDVDVFTEALVAFLKIRSLKPSAKTSAKALAGPPNLYARN